MKTTVKSTEMGMGTLVKTTSTYVNRQYKPFFFTTVVGAIKQNI